MDDKAFPTIMDREVFQDIDHSWVTPLPFRSSRRPLPSNREQAVKRLCCLRKTLEKKPETNSHYMEFMQKMLVNDQASHAKLQPRQATVTTGYSHATPSYSHAELQPRRATATPGYSHAKLQPRQATPSPSYSHAKLQPRQATASPSYSHAKLHPRQATASPSYSHAMPSYSLAKLQSRHAKLQPRQATAMPSHAASARTHPPHTRDPEHSHV